MNDYLAAEPLIIARLEDQIANVTIKSTWGMPRIQETPNLPPAVLVFLEKDISGQVHLGNHKVEQTWLCLVMVQDARLEAGPLISQVIKAMHGWRPEDRTFSAFRRVPSGFAHEYSPTGVFYFPLAFATEFVFNS
ncbi:MAG: hypothetical protein HQL89_09025 [Magnetococcales bacterium]|nr:hypothetical protein [Magnetococcales bacterium]